MKKSILVLTDFSENALHAAEIAFILAGQLKTNLSLLNCNDTISAFTYYPVVPVMSESPTWYEDRKSKLKAISEHLEQKFHLEFPEQAKPVIKCLIREGDLQTNLKDLLKHQPLEMIVMGARSGSLTDHILFGSNTKTIANHSPIPVLVAPLSALVRRPLLITFATNFLEQDFHSLNYIAQLRQRLGARLEIVHIREYGQIPDQRDPKTLHLIEKICNADPRFIVFKEVYGKDVSSRLNHYCLNNESDILALSDNHHSFFNRVFIDDNVDKSLAEHLVPILVIPELKSSQDIHKNTFRGLSNVVF